MPAVTHRLAGAVCLLATLIAAQSGLAVLPVGDRHEAPTASRRAIAWTRSGRAFAGLLRGTDAAGAPTLQLFDLTADAGPTGIALLPSTDAVGPFAIVADRHAELLHVVTSESDGNDSTSVRWRRFDLETRAWVGDAVCLAKGSGPEDAYVAEDVEVTDSGAVVVALSSHRRPPNPPWTRGWSTALRVLRPGAEAWSDLLLANPGGTGVCASLAADGEVVHITYRNVTEGCGIYHRAYDVAAARWLADRDQKISGTEAGIESSNFSALVVDGAGGLWAAYSAGDSGFAKGRVEVAYRAPGAEVWRRLPIAEDPGRRGGNRSQGGVTLATGPADHVFVIWSNIGEGQRRLYRRALAAGQAIGPVEVIAEATDGEPGFERVTGARTSHHFGTLLALTSGAGDHAGPARLIAPRWPPRAVAR